MAKQGGAHRNQMRQLSLGNLAIDRITGVQSEVYIWHGLVKDLCLTPGGLNLCYKGSYASSDASGWRLRSQQKA